MSHIKETMVSVPVHVLASSSNWSDLAFHCFSWVPLGSDTSQWLQPPSYIAGGMPIKLWVNQGAGEKQAVGPRMEWGVTRFQEPDFPQRETKRKQTKGRDRSKQAPQTGPLCYKNRALNFTKLRKGSEPGVKHSLCNSLEEWLTEHT